MNILSLTYLRTVLHAVCLLYKEHVSVILWGLHYLGSSSSIFNIHSEAFVWWRALWAMVIAMSHLILTSHLVVLTILSLGSLRSSISCSKATKTWRVHLFLQQIAWTSIMNIWVVLQPLQQIVLRIVWSWTMSIKWATSSRLIIHWAAIDHVIYEDTTLSCYSWLATLTSSSCSIIMRKLLLLLHLKVMKNLFHIILIVHMLLFTLFSSLFDSSVCSLYCMLISRSSFGCARHIWTIISVSDAWSRNAIKMLLMLVGLSCVEASSVNVLIGANRHIAALMNSCLGDWAVVEIAVFVHNLCGWFLSLSLILKGATLRMHQLIIFVQYICGKKANSGKVSSCHSSVWSLYCVELQKAIWWKWLLSTQ